MIHALNLLWIVPLAACFGFLVSALMVAAGGDKADGKDVSACEG